MWLEFIYLGSLNFAIVMTAVLLLWLISIPARDVSIIDMAFAPLMALVAGMTFLNAGGVTSRKLLITSLVVIWAVRMGVHLIKRNWGHGEDPRYAKLRTWCPEGWPFYCLSLKQVFLLQGIVIWAATLPVQFAQIYQTPTGLGWLALSGVLIWLSGFLFEVIGDQQLARFKANPDNEGKILNTGLWKYTRHPNYFGEVTLWWGLFIIACENPWALLTIIGPLLYTYLIIKVTGKATLEKKMSKERPGYADYIANTSGFFPMPPRQTTY